MLRKCLNNVKININIHIILKLYSNYYIKIFLLRIIYIISTLMLKYHINIWYLI